MVNAYAKIILSGILRNLHATVLRDMPFSAPNVIVVRLLLLVAQERILLLSVLLVLPLDGRSRTVSVSIVPRNQIIVTLVEQVKSGCLAWVVVSVIGDSST